MPFATMADVLGPSIVLITLALISYTTGVWAERWRGTLAWWHIGAFGVGLLCDASGSFLMARMAQSGTVSAEMNPLLTSIMTVTGTLALGLMAVHLVWAIVTMVRGSEVAKARFHRFSVVVWAIWLVPYFSGMLAGMV